MPAPGLVEAVDAAFAGLPTDVRAVVLHGPGRALSSGHELTWSAEENSLEWLPQRPATRRIPSFAQF